MDFKAWIQEQDPEWLQAFEIEQDSINTALCLAIRYGDWEAVKILAPAQDDIWKWRLDCIDVCCA